MTSSDPRQRSMEINTDKALQMADLGSSLAETKPLIPQRGKKVGFYKKLLQAFVIWRETHKK